MLKMTLTHISVVIHAIEWLAKHEGVYPDYVMLLQPTTPFRTSDDIDAAIELSSSMKPMLLLV